VTDAPKDKRFLTCDAIQDVLTAYMSRELGAAPSRAVREHLRTCEDCRREAADIQTALDMLKAATPAPADDAVLSAARRKRLTRAATHPIQEWMIVHRRLIALVTALAVIALSLYLVRDASLTKPEPDVDRIPIWRYFRSGDLPALVEEAMERQRQEEAEAAQAE